MKTTWPNVKLAQFPFSVIFATVLVPVSSGLGKGGVRLFLVKIFLNSPCALVIFCVFFLLSQGGELAFPYLGQESLKGFCFFVCGFSQPLCWATAALSDYLVTDGQVLALITRWLTQPTLLFDSFQF